MDAAAKDKQIPVGLIVVGELLLVAAALRAGGRGAGLALAAVGVATVVGVLLMLVAAFVTAAVTRTSFGEFGPAVLKLAGVYLMSNGVSAVLAGTGLGGLLGGAVFFGLVVWLFDLDLPYAVVFAILYWVVSVVVGLLVYAAFGSPDRPPARVPAITAGPAVARQPRPR